MEATRHLHAVDALTGEVVAGGCPDCRVKDAKLEQLQDEVTGVSKKLAAASGQVTRLGRELASMRAENDDEWHDDVLEVLTFWRPLLMPDAEVVAGTPRWERVRSRLKEDKDEETGRLVWTVPKLKGAVVGMTLDPWTMDLAHKHRRDLANAFRNADRVNSYFQLVVTFRRETGTSALEIVDELQGPALSWLADRCSCGQLRVAHLMGRAVCEFDEFEAKVARFMADRDRLAS